MQTSCTIDVTYYPFDQQTCLIKIGALDPAHRLAIAQNINFVLLDEYYLSGQIHSTELLERKCAPKIDCSL